MENENYNKLEAMKLEMPIDSFDFSERTKSCLDRTKITKASELVLYSEPDLMNVRNLGQGGIEEIKEAIHSVGLKLKDEES